MSTGQIAFNYTLLSEEATTMLFALMRAPFSPYHLHQKKEQLVSG